jgi:IS1 family transposase
MVGGRDFQAAREFMEDLASRLANRVQLTTDGHRVYVDAVEEAFGADIDYAMLVKMYGADQHPDETRYSPAVCVGSRSAKILGKPDPKHISTSYVERQNLTMRMHMRRFTRLTNAFSKKIQNHIAAISLHFMYYNFVRIHQSLRVTPAMAAGVTERAFEIADIVAIFEDYERCLEEQKKAERLQRLEQAYAQFGSALGHEL